MNTRGTTIQMTMSDGARIGVYQVQASGTRRGGLVLIQEIFGVTEHIQQQCDRFADEGYEVWAPALFDREAPGLNLGRGPEDMSKALKLARELHPFALSVADALTCIDALAAKGPAFITGYCYGGSVTWAAACRSDALAAASGYYGSQIPAMAAQQPRCPTILHFGRLDASIAMDSVEKIQSAHPELPVHLYDAGHGFNGDGPHHDAASAQLAFERTLALFRSAP
ncbi:MAG: dienelactone hydrolase family protein [Rhizobacter sp.]